MLTLADNGKIGGWFTVRFREAGAAERTFEEMRREFASQMLSFRNGFLRRRPGGKLPAIRL